MITMKYENQHCRGCIILHCEKQDRHSAKSNPNDGIRLGCRLPPSHLSNDRTSSALRSVCRRLSVCIATAIAAFMLTACSKGSGTKSFRSSNEAIREYYGFLTSLRKNDKVSIQTLEKAINDWRVLDDSVVSCIARDTISMSHSYPYAAYREINDSIHIELCRMAMSRQRSFHDLLHLREQTSPHADDKELQQAVKEALPFFASLDSLPIYNKGGKQAVLKRYQQFLQKSVKQGIHSKDDLLSFIKEEHLHFKAFLQYLPDFADNNIGDIRRYTEQCCVQILRAADRKALSHKDAMIYLSMRTNLRLLRNAQAAIADLKNGRVKDEQTMHAYLLMMMQPFMSMDDLSLSVLSDKDKAELYKVADAIPKEMDNLAKLLHLDKKRLSDMPMLMIKIYITRL